ncbi:MAG: CDP-glycerol glycerophosphotransferase family protein [Alphaproteobacteria bacterium]|nr:CDP-glycerol glycerophosphotransferase family protein [Alphaproteobacteria bacterium]
MSKKAIYRVLKVFGYLFPVKKNKVIFNNINGLGYACNPKYIAEEMLKDGDFQLFWVVDKNKTIDYKSFPEQIKLVKLGSYSFIYHLFTSQFIISNVRFDIWNWYKKRKEQLYIQTWHGGLGLKKVEADLTNLPDFYINAAKLDAANTDFMMADSEFQKKQIFERAFWYDGPVCEFGLPRHDIFFQDNSNIKNKVCDTLHIDKNIKICMYAPTFRNSYSLDVYKLDYAALRHALINKFGDEWIILSRLHPNLAHMKNVLPDLPYVYDASKYPDMQELLAASDVVISDYSSCLLDFMITKRPGFIFATDIDAYIKERDFYISLYDFPFTIATNNNELVSNIQSFDNDTYTQSVNSFLKDKGLYDDGHASEKVVNLLRRTSK